MSYVFPPCAAPVPGNELALEFLQKKGIERERWVTAQVQAGRVPDFLRASCRVPVYVEDTTYFLQVAPDYLCVGTNEDYFYTQINVRTAQALADSIGAMLPTAKIVDMIWKHAHGRFTPRPQGAPYDNTMSSSKRCLQQTTTIFAERTVPVGSLVAGHAKDYVLSPRTRPGKTCIYGWHRPDGTVIQPINSVSHSVDYVDYSQMTRFVSKDIVCPDGDTLSLPEVFKGRTALMTALTGAVGPFLRGSEASRFFELPELPEKSTRSSDLSD